MPLFRKQSAAMLPSLTPHDSKARLIVVTIRRDSWRSHVHRTCTAQRVQSFKLQTANVRGQGARPLAFSWGFKGDILSHERISPLSRAAPTALLPRAFGTKKSSLCRENSFSLFFNTALRRRECDHLPSANATFLRRFRDARRRSACRTSRCPSSCAGAG